MESAEGLELSAEVRAELEADKKKLRVEGLRSLGPIMEQLAKIAESEVERDSPEGLEIQRQATKDLRRMGQIKGEIETINHLLGIKEEA